MRALEAEWSPGCQHVDAGIRTRRRELRYVTLSLQNSGDKPRQVMAHESTADVSRDLIAGEPIDACRKMPFTHFELPPPDLGSRSRSFRPRLDPHALAPSGRYGASGNNASI